MRESSVLQKMSHLQSASFTSAIRMYPDSNFLKIVNCSLFMWTRLQDLQSSHLCKFLVIMDSQYQCQRRDGWFESCASRQTVFERANRRLAWHFTETQTCYAIWGSKIRFERPPVQDVDVPPDHEVARAEEVLPAQPLRRRELVRFCVQTSQ